MPRPWRWQGLPRQRQRGAPLFLAQDLAELGQRTILPLGSIAVHGRSSAKGLELSLDGRSLTTLRREHFSGLPGIDGPVQLELVALETAGLCLTLKHGKRFLCSIPIGTHDLPEPLKEVLATRDERAGQAKVSYAIIAEALAKSELQGAVEGLRRTWRGMLDEWLIPLALMHVSDERLPEVRERMRESGFLNIFGGDAKLLLDAAVASLSIPSPNDFASVESFHQWSEPTPEDSILRVAEIVTGQLGFPPFLIGEDGNFEKAAFI